VGLKDAIREKKKMVCSRESFNFVVLEEEASGK
jgi:hypothetical protein